VVGACVVDGAVGFARGRLWCWGEEWVSLAAGGSSAGRMSAGSWLNTYHLQSCVGVGQQHTVALSDNSNVISFGGNRQGQLGVGSGVSMSSEAIYVRDPTIHQNSSSLIWRSSPVQVACGSLHTMLLLANGDLYAWGFNESRRLGLPTVDGDDGDGPVSSDTVVFTPQCVQDDQVETGSGPKLLKELRLTKEFRVTYVACGADHTLCIDQNGDVWTWGVGNYGNLGHGSNQSEPSPRIVEALRGQVMRVVAGGSKHSGSVSRKGKLYMWGHGDKGRLGNGAQRGTSTPELVESMTHEFVVFVACGEAHSACITDAGELYTWGGGSYGRLGHGEESDVFNPVKVEALNRSQVIVVSLGVFHSCCLLKDGSMFVWGGGQYGKLGLNGTDNELSPQKIPAAAFEGDPVVQVFAGSSHTVAVCKGGAIYSWGDSVKGKLGQGQLNRYTAPKRIHLPRSMQFMRITPSLIGSKGVDIGGSGEDPSLVQRSLDLSSNSICAVSVGAKHSMALTFDGALFAWGGNEFGQIGVGSREDVRTPVRVKIDGSTRHRVIGMAAGVHHSLCCITQGDVFAWGRGNEAQIGTGSTITETLPVLVQSLQGQRIVSVYGAEAHSAALSDDGRLFTWGDPDMGKLGHGRSLTDSDSKFDTVSLPRVVKGCLANRKVVQVSLGTSHSGCIDSFGKVYTWGAGWQGKLGLGNTDNQYLPQPVVSLQFQTCRNISCGTYHTMFVTDDGDLYVCGRGDARLGLGDTNEQLNPILNSALRSLGVIVIQSCAAEEHSMVLANDGRVWTWGKDQYGKLGHGNKLTTHPNQAKTIRIESTPRVIEQNVLNLNNFRVEEGADDIRSIVSYSNHCMVLEQDGSVFVWGSTGGGRLGIPNTEAGTSYKDIPTRIPNFASRQREELVTAAKGPEVPMTPKVDNPESKDDTEGGVGANSGVAGVGSMELLNATIGTGADRNELETHLRTYMETGKAPPLYVIQLFLKAEPKQRKDKGLASETKTLLQAEETLCQTFIDLVTAEEEVQNLDYCIGLTIASTLRRLNVPGTGPVGMSASGTGTGLNSRANSQGGPMQTTRANSVQTLSKDVMTKIPSYQHVFMLLLANPKYMIAMYKIFVSKTHSHTNKNESENMNDTTTTTAASETRVTELQKSVDWQALYFELVQCLYPFGDLHTDHLFLMFARSILKLELDSFLDISKHDENSEAKNEPDMAAGSRVGNSSVPKRSFKAFVQPKMKCPSFIHFANLFFGQQKVLGWLHKHFESVLTELFRGHRSRTSSGDEVNLCTDPVKILHELKGNTEHAIIGDSSAVDPFREEVANYPDVRRELGKRVTLLSDITVELFQTIAIFILSLPHEVRLFCKILHEELSRVFGGDAQAAPIEFDQAVGKFLMDYLFRPAFLSPKQRHVLPRHFGAITQQQRRNMVNIVSFLQSIVSDRLYAEPWLEPLNLVIRQYRSQVQVMVNNLINVPSNLEDTLYTDLFEEYLRPKNNMLTLQVSNRSLKFVRFAMNHGSSSMICTKNDPLYLSLTEMGGILSLPTDRISAAAFIEEYGQLKDENNFKLNLEVELRFLGIQGSTEKKSQREKINLRDGIRIDPVSQVPVPLWMVENEGENAARLELMQDTGESGDELTTEQRVRRELVKLPELSKKAGVSELKTALEKSLKQAASDGEYGRAQKIHNALRDVNELSTVTGENGYDSLLREFLTSLMERREAEKRIQHRLSSVKKLEKKANRRLQELRSQKTALTNYLDVIRDGSANSGRQEVSKSASMLVMSAHHAKSKSGAMSRIASSMKAEGVTFGAYAKYSLKQLMDNKVVTSFVENEESVSILRAKRAKIRFIFESLKTGQFNVNIILEGAIMDQFSVTIGQLANMEKIIKLSYRPSILPFIVSVSQFRIMLEEITMGQILTG